MKWPLFLLIIWATISAINAQDLDQSTNSLFDDSQAKTYNPGSILVQGEVQTPATIDLSRLPLRSAPIKELGLENGKQVFRGAYFVSGYSLCDILNNVKIKKAPQNTFRPLLDMYVIVENDKGEKVVFSWGEIYQRESFDILVTRNIQPIIPSRAKTKWPLPDEPRLVCGTDLLNVRFMGNPTKITVKSYFEGAASEKPKDAYAPEIKILAKTNTATVGNIGPSVGKRGYKGIIYGHGMGFLDVLNITGGLLKDVIAANIKFDPENLRKTVAIISARDGYRAAFSASEIMNRNDNQDYVLNDLKDSSNGGRYTLIVASDFFADRNVKSVEKITLVDIE